jgi:hypothetical protein
MLLALVNVATAAARELPKTSGGVVSESPVATVWWAGSGASKIRPDAEPPESRARAIEIRAARNETDAAQCVVRPHKPLRTLRIACTALKGTDGEIGADRIEIFQVDYIDIKHPTDRRGAPGPWPDPLLPIRAPLDLEKNRTQPFWVRVAVPRDAAPGPYRGLLEFSAKSWHASVPVELTVFDFVLPDRMSCTTAFGFSEANVFRYHRLETEAQKRKVLETYWATLADHHISPYDPAPLDPIVTNWPAVKPPRTVWDDWTNLRIVSNEVHSGKGAMLLHDDKTDRSVSTTYQPLIPIPPKGLRLLFWARTAVPGHRFQITFNHYDKNKQWLSGHNNDMTFQGNGRWQEIERTFPRKSFPKNAAFVRLHFRAAHWTESGEQLGLAWIDDVSLAPVGGGKNLVNGGDFEKKPRKKLTVPPERLRPRLDFSAWDRAMERAIDRYHFNSFRLRVPGMGGGNFHALSQPSLLGFSESEIEYPYLFGSWCRQMEEHLRQKGWLDEAFVYWFDEPSPDQYPFVLDGFRKLKRHLPDIDRMLTEQVEPGLVGGPNVWCPVSSRFDAAKAAERRRHGEKFWWYVCCGPKAPYAGEFIDHPAPEMRIWLWQTFKRGIQGVLVWQTTYWTSATAYPDPKHPQNPYADPMSWTTGYGIPKGTRRPWGNGDGRFLYPPLAAVDPQGKGPVFDAPVDSIRIEHLRDGIEDYEYLCMLRKLLEKRGAGLPAGKRAEFRALLEVPPSITRSLTDFAAAGAPIENRRLQIARAIEKLAR